MNQTGQKVFRAHFDFAQKSKCLHKHALITLKGILERSKRNSDTLVTTKYTNKTGSSAVKAQIGPEPAKT